MYGPIRPDTKAIGSKAAMTVKVARMVGRADFIDRGRNRFEQAFAAERRCRWIFSTTTMASSTRMPMEKISANSDTRFKVKPMAHEANKVMAKRQI